MGEYGEPQSRNETILQNMLGEDYPMLEPQSRIETLLQALLGEWQGITVNPEFTGSTFLFTQSIPNYGEYPAINIDEKYNTAIGMQARNSGDDTERSTALGCESQTRASNSCAIDGGLVNTGAINGIAIGKSTLVNAPYGIAIGTNACVDYGADGAICIANVSSSRDLPPKATIPNQVLIGRFLNTSDANFNNYRFVFGDGTARSNKKNVITLDTSGNFLANLATIAPVYDATATYALDDYVFYDRLLYRCTTAIDTAEAWTAAHWTQCTVMSEIKRLMT